MDETFLSDSDKSRQVLARLGANVGPYIIERGYPDWDEVVERYGDRFKGATLVHLAGSTYFDDSVYESYGDQWAIAAADVVNPSRVIAECFLQEIRDGSNDRIKLRAHGGGAGSPCFAWYASDCDHGLLFSRGIIFAYFTELTKGSLPSLEAVITSEEWDIVYGNSQPW